MEANATLTLMERRRLLDRMEAAAIRPDLSGCRDAADCRKALLLWMLDRGYGHGSAKRWRQLILNAPPTVDGMLELAHHFKRLGEVASKGRGLPVSLERAIDLGLVRTFDALAVAFTRAAGLEEAEGRRLLGE